MDQVEEKNQEMPPAEKLDEIVAKVKAIAKGPYGDLFFKVVDSFFELTEPEYFSSKDLAEIQEGIKDIRQGRYLTLEEYRQGKRL